MASDDACDIDTLTAFLEDSDDESQDHERKEDDNHCSMEEITAFLEASDEEEEDTESTTVDIGQGRNSVNKEKSSEDAEDDLCAIEKESSCTGGLDDSEQQCEMSDLDEMDFDELDSLVESQNTSQCSNINKDKDDYAYPTSETDPKDGESSLESETQNSVTGEKESLTVDNDSEDRDEYLSDSCDVDAEAETEEPDDPDSVAHDTIKAEMAAMAERMKQLQELLEKNTPKSKSKPKSMTKQGPDCNKEKSVKSPKPSIASDKKHTQVHSPSDTATKKNTEVHTGSNAASKKHTLVHNTSKSKSTEIRLSDKSRENSPKINKDLCNKEIKRFDSKERRSDKQVCDREAKVQGSSTAVSKTFMSASKPTMKAVSPKVRENSSDSKQIDGNTNPFFDEIISQGSEVKVDPKTIFGDSDDSDWEDLAGEEKVKLSDQGREMKKLLNQGIRTREAHTPKYDTSVLKKPAAVSTWSGVSSSPVQKAPFFSKMEVEKPKLNPETGTVSGKYKVKEEYMPKSTIPYKEDNREFVQDPYCGIRIVNPRISMAAFKSKMEGRSMVKISRLLSKCGTSDLQKDNWVTMGVVVHKTEPRQSASGKTYCIWKLSDLNNCDQSVTFFLFSNVYKEHWKNELGVVVGLLNPSIMDKAEKAQSDVALTIKHPQQLLIMGVSKDLGRCTGTTKAGSVCGNFINRTQGEYCTYHVQAAYRKSSSKRTELQASTGKAPKAFEQRKKVGPNSNNSCFFYGGQTFTTMTPRTTNTKDKVTLRKLQAMEAGKEQGKLTTMSLHELKPEDTQKLQRIKEKDKQLLELLSVPTAGSMNFVKHLVKKDKTDKQSESTDEPETQSVSAKDLLKQHQVALKQKQMAHKASMNPLTAIPKLGKGFQMGDDISLDVPVKRNTNTNAAAEFAKQLAIAKVQRKGGITKEDPNAVRKKITSPENREKIRKRVAEDMDTATNDKTVAIEPPKKRSKLLGNLDLNSDEVQKLLKAKSKHKGALAEAEAEHEERYFSSLEKKEQMEEKMGSIMEVSVTLFACKQCNYKYFSLHDRCKQENHIVKKINGTKRFFKCKQCKKRCISLDKMPTKPCKECGSSSFERVSMLKEKSGPKLESEELSIRGNEQKFVGALQGKTYLNV